MIMTNYVLASSGNAVTEGGLGNQTPLIIRAVDEDDDDEGEEEIFIPTGTFDTDSVKTAAEARGLRLGDEIYAHIVAALESGKHVILTGPPGRRRPPSLKPSRGRPERRPLPRPRADDGDRGLDDLRDDRRAQADADWQARVRSRATSWMRSTHDQWLVIDELNRSNFDRAFGQLFTVLSGQAVELPYEREGKLGRLVLAPPDAPTSTRRRRASRSRRAGGSSRR